MAQQKLKNTKKGMSYYNHHLVDMITPVGLEFSKRDFWFGDNLARVILVTKYPSRVDIGWMSKVANMEGVTCSIHLSPTDSGKLIDDISSSISELRVRVNNGGKPLDAQRNERQLEDAERLLKQIDQEQENVFFVTVSILVLARDKDELERRSKRVESALSGQSMRGRAAVFQQDDALLAVSPYAICPQSVKFIADRNMPVSTIAGAYPFNASGLNDGQGYIFGRVKGGGIILIDTWKRGGDRTNSNWVIFGPPGTGKSTSVKKIGAVEYAQGTKCIFIDPEREYKDFCKNVGGKWINCGGGRGGRINPLQVRNVPLDDKDDEELEDEGVSLFKDEGHGIGPLALHFQILRTFFRLYLKSLDDDLQATLEELLEELYASKGITWDTDVSQIKNEEYPVIKELWDLAVKYSEDKDVSLKRRDRCESLALKLRSAAIGADAALWNGHTTANSTSDFIVLDTHNLVEADETIQRAQYFNILTWAWHEIANDREEKVFLAVDESYLLADPNVPQTLYFLRNVSKRIRKYMGGLAVITHSVVDFLDPSVRRAGQALLDNPCFKLILGADGKNLQDITELFSLTEAEQEMLTKKRRGEGLFIAGSKRIHAIIDIADFELQLFGKGGGQ